MEKDNINKQEEKEFEKLQTLLKDLPQIKAPDNFEYNLLTRIQNKNFELQSEKKKKVFFRIYAPSFALAASVALVFFLFSDESIDSEDPWNSQPKLRPEMQVSESVKSELPSEEGIQSQNDEIVKSEVKEKVSLKIQQPSPSKDIAVKKATKPDYPFDEKTSVDLDEMIDSPSPQTTDNGITNPQLAGNNISPPAVESDFKGFFIRQIEAEARKESLRTHEDSLNQSNDSLNKVKDSLKTNN